MVISMFMVLTPFATSKAHQQNLWRWALLDERSSFYWFARDILVLATTAQFCFPAVHSFLTPFSLGSQVHFERVLFRCRGGQIALCEIPIGYFEVAVIEYAGIGVLFGKRWRSHV